MFSVFALLITAFFAAGCGGTEMANNTTKPAASPGVSTSSSSTDKKADVATAGNTGVAECDDYIAKVEACVMNKVPADQREIFKSSMDQQRAAWEKAAANESTKGALAGACKQALDAAKNSYSTYGCTF